jgi:hypothetical protein
MLNGTYTIKILLTDRSLLFRSLSDVHVETQKQFILSLLQFMTYI